jgi:hypothetical protein
MGAENPHRRDVYTAINNVIPKDRQVVWETVQKFGLDRDIEWTDEQGNTVRTSADNPNLEQLLEDHPERRR